MLGVCSRSQDRTHYVEVYPFGFSRKNASLVLGRTATFSI